MSRDSVDSTRAKIGGSPGWVVVRVAAVELGIGIEAVGEVLPTPEIVRVPMAPLWVAGVVSVRGEVVPVIDLGLRLFGRAADRSGRLLLATVPGTTDRVGLLVDSVSGLLDRATPVSPATTRRTATEGVPARFLAATLERASDARLPVIDLAAALDTGADPAA